MIIDGAVDTRWLATPADGPVFGFHLWADGRVKGFVYLWTPPGARIAAWAADDEHGHRLGFREWLTDAQSLLHDYAVSAPVVVRRPLVVRKPINKRRPLTPR